MELSSFNWARSKMTCRPVSGAKRWSSFRRTKSSREGGVSWLAAHLRELVNHVARGARGGRKIYKEWQGLPVLEAIPSQAHRGIDAHEQKEGPTQQGIDYLVIPYVCSHKPLPPTQCHKLEQCVDVGKSVASIVVRSRNGGVRSRLFYGGSGSGTLEMDPREPVLLDQVGGYGGLACANAWLRY